MKKQQDLHQRCKEGYADAREEMRDQAERIKEDLRFSNPANPEQWAREVLTARQGRPCLTFDKTNQFIAQVVNDARQNKPAIHCMPADAKADIAVAEKLNGIVRHIEYRSRAGVAYDAAIELAARVGLGWLRIVPEVVNGDTNEQEILIKRVHDPLSVHLQAGWTEPDGSDALCGWAETVLTKKAFERLYPKAYLDSWDVEWFSKDSVKVCEYFEVDEQQENRLVVNLRGEEMTLTEDEYWDLAERIGMRPELVHQYMAKTRTVRWSKHSGCEVLEETIFPSRYVPLIPALGDEIWIDGQRYLCGMVRKLMDGQRAHNYEESARIEAVALQPKAPYIAAWEGIENHEDAWRQANQGSPAYLPFNAFNGNGEPIPPPQRQMPPTFPVAFAQGGEIAVRSMEAAVGMYRSNLGAQSNAVSGRAKLADKREGDTANFHYLDNLTRSIEQVGRVIVDMIPRIYDTKRQARIVGEDDQQDFVTINPDLPGAVSKQGKKVVEINPGVGSYDVRVKAGPSYTSLRQESAEQLSLIFQAAPQLVPVLGDEWVRSQDWPGADKMARRLKALLPPEIQAIEQEDGPDIPPEVVGQIQQLQAQIEQLSEALQQASREVDEKDQALKDKSQEIEVKKYQADTDRLSKLGELGVPPEQLATSDVVVGALMQQQQTIESLRDSLAPDMVVGALVAQQQSIDSLRAGLADAVQQMRAPQSMEFIYADGVAQGVRKSDGTVVMFVRDPGSGRPIGAVAQ